MPIVPKAFALLWAISMSGCGDPPASKATPAALSSAPSYWLPSLKAERVGAKRTSCVDQLDVELSVSGERITGALIADDASGECDALVIPNKRFYELRMIAEDCGSRVYEATLASTRGPSYLRLADHSQRRCEGKAFTLEIEERHAGTSHVRRYGGHWN